MELNLTAQAYVIEQEVDQSGDVKLTFQCSDGITVSVPMRKAFFESLPELNREKPTIINLSIAFNQDQY